MIHNIDDSPDSQGNNYNFAGVAAGSALRDDSSFKEQDRLLPIANVARIMKQMLPSNAKISKEAKETMQECVSEFISFVTGEASDKCHKEKRKTVNGDDVCWALGTLGFDSYTDPLKRYLHKHREYEGERTSQNKGSNNTDQVEPLCHSSDHGRNQPSSAPNLSKFNLMEKGNSSNSRLF